MGKIFIPLVVVMLALSTVFVAAIGTERVDENGEKICVESRSCAIRYMNNLEKNQNP